jgi:hypothetical protein
MRRHPFSSSETGARDAALRKLRILNRCLIAGSITLTGVLAEVAANAFPGRTVRTAATRHPPPRPPRRQLPSRADPLRAPAQPPQAVNTQTSATAPAHETTSPPETTPAQEATPAQESAPTSEPAGAASSTPEPAQEPAPVVSGGS